MKAIKQASTKAFAVLMAAVLALGLAFAGLAASGSTKSAFAEGETYSITIKDAVSGETYNAYKIFDATYVTENDADTGEETISSISYTISTSSEWYPAMQAYTQEVTTTGDDGTTSTSEEKPFTFTASAADSSVMVVTVKDGMTVDAATLAAYLNEKLHATGANFTAAKTETASSTTVTLEVSSTGAGYYFVDTSLGALCSLNNVTGTEVTMYEKNSAPKITKQVKEDDNNSTHTGDAAYKDTAILDVIDIVSYQLTVNTGTNTNYNTELGTVTGVDADYEIVDTLPTGIAYKDGTIAVSVTVDGTKTDWVENTDYTVVWTPAVAADADTGTEATLGTLKITLLSTGKLASLAEDTDIVITYNAAITASEVDMTNTGNTNNVKLTYKNQESTDTAVVKTYDLLNDADDEGNPSFQKVDGNGDALKGVTFVLSRTVGTDTKYAVVDTNGYLVDWSATEVEATDESTNTSYLVTDDNGGINVKGLDAGTYILTETATLDGYNLLTDTITVVIAENGDVTYRMTSSTAANAEVADIEIENLTGTELPSTGGIGTTIFYIIGGILVVGAAVLLITKRRMNGRD